MARTSLRGIPSRSGIPACRPDGRIGLANRPPDGFIGEVFRRRGRHMFGLRA